MEIESNILKALEQVDASRGLGEALFLSVSTLTPIANVDLLILDEKHRLLLKRRDDPYFGAGWHIPGGCIRFRETMEERAQKTAVEEIGGPVIIHKLVAVRDVIIDSPRPGLQNQNYRAHHLAVLFQCILPAQTIADRSFQERLAGENLKWFHTLPDDLLRVHEVYLDDLKQFGIERKEQV